MAAINIAEKLTSKGLVELLLHKFGDAYAHDSAEGEDKESSLRKYQRQLLLLVLTQRKRLLTVRENGVR